MDRPHRLSRFDRIADCDIGLPQAAGEGIAVLLVGQAAVERDRLRRLVGNRFSEQADVEQQPGETRFRATQRVDGDAGRAAQLARKPQDAMSVGDTDGFLVMIDQPLENAALTRL